MKKVLSIIMLAAMLLTFAVSVSAAEKGSITINGMVNGSVYKIYKILDLESYDKTNQKYSYKVADGWAGFFATAEAKTYMAVDAHNYVTWVGAEDEDAVAAFAKLALAYAKANNIPAVRSSAVAADITITDNVGKFTNLDLGYYLIDSTLGALCGLTTTNPDASINAKNGIPVVEKQVLEDSTNQWTDKNTADVGQTVEFRTTITVHAGAENYVLHDKMSAGLTFLGVTKIHHIIPGQDEHDTPTTLYEVKTDGLTDDCTFEVHFSNELTEKLSTNDKIIVYYEAMLNRNAIVASTGNPNETWLQFGDNNTTTHDTTVTYTYGFDIIKTDSQFTLIDGAQFKIYDAATGGNEVAVVLMDDGVTYRRARADETGISIVVKDGKVRVVGFDNGTYYLEETVSPVGYNKLAARQRFIIADADLNATFNGDIYSTGSGVHVVNKSGEMLPETGGMGTTLFVVFGAIVMLGTGVVLFTRKRLSQIAE